jgi:hypothetical protein
MKIKIIKKYRQNIRGMKERWKGEEGVKHPWQELSLKTKNNARDA